MRLVLVASFCGCKLGGLQAASAPTPAQSPGAWIGIGGLLAFNSTIGRAAKAALELAVRDVNNASVLGESTQLVLHLGNTNCSAFQGAAAGNVIASPILHHQKTFLSLLIPMSVESRVSPVQDICMGLKSLTCKLYFDGDYYYYYYDCYY